MLYQCIALSTNRRDHWHAKALATYLNPLGAEFELLDADAGRYKVSGMAEIGRITPRLDVYSREFGRGKVVFVVGTEWWSRKRLGHAFHVPGSDQRLCYETLAVILNEVTTIAPKNRRSYRILEL